MCAAAPARACAQQTGSVQGRVTERLNGTPLSGIRVSVEGGRSVATTSGDGRFRLNDVAPGTSTLRFSWIGYRGKTLEVSVAAGAMATADIVLDPQPIALSEVTVVAVSRQPESLLRAPAAVSVAEQARVQELAVTGQTPRIVGDLPGIHAPQSGVYDYNLNARGFNDQINRRVLVLVDGRDVSIPIQGSQEWGDVAVDEAGTRVEFVRGPGSALYGANAVSGVLSIVTPPVRDAVGTRLRLGGGELSTLRFDARQAGVTANSRLGYRVAGGYATSKTFDVSRTNLGDLASEYGPAVGSSGAVNTPYPGYELLALNGQSKQGPFGLPGAALGSPDPVTRIYGSARLDYYPEDGSILTAEGGTSRLDNVVFMNPGGRAQVTKSTRPWARAEWSSRNLNASVYYTGREADQVQLSAGTPALESSHTLHTEVQYNTYFLDRRGLAVIGGSFRTQSIDSKGTSLLPVADGRAEQYESFFGQASYEFTPRIRLVFAGRVDEGAGYSTQFSPKAGLVISPSAAHSFRFTLNRGFLLPNTLARFISLPAGPPQDLSKLETGLRASPLGPLLAGVPDGQLFTKSSAVPVLVRGNDAIRPQGINGLELGYKGQIGRVFLTADAFYSELSDFLTSARPGVNPKYGPWTAPAAVPQSVRAAVEGAVAQAVGPALTRLEDGSSALVLSIANAGHATEWGLELSGSVSVTDRVRLDANYTYYRFGLGKTFLPGDSIQSNTPAHTGNLAAVYQSLDGLRVRLGLRLVDRYLWRSSIWNGAVPTSQSVDVNVSRTLNPNVALTLSGTNLLDQRRFQVYGGSIVGRQVLGGVTWTP